MLPILGKIGIWDFFTHMKHQLISIFWESIIIGMCDFSRNSTYERKLDEVGDFLYPNIMTQECIRLGHDRFWYITVTDYYPESVSDVYDWLEHNDEMGTLSVVYRNTWHMFSIEVIGAAVNIHCGHTTEQFPKGSQPFINWANEIVPGV